MEYEVSFVALHEKASQTMLIVEELHTVRATRPILRWFSFASKGLPWTWQILEVVSEPNQVIRECKKDQQVESFVGTVGAEVLCFLRAG